MIAKYLALFPDSLLFVRRGFGNKAIAVSHERCFILFSKYSFHYAYIVV